MDKFHEISQDTKDQFFEVFNKKSFPVGIKFQFLGFEKQRELIKIQKISDQYSFILEKEILVTFNEDLISVFDQESITILIEQEIDKININIDTGKIKLIKTDLNTFSALVNKYGVEKVSRANKVSELYQEQKADAKVGEEFIV